jgi:hypothetical protein
MDDITSRALFVSKEISKKATDTGNASGLTGGGGHKVSDSLFLKRNSASCGGGATKSRRNSVEGHGATFRKTPYRYQLSIPQAVSDL